VTDADTAKSIDPPYRVYHRPDCPADVELSDMDIGHAT
jgi:hypothetical protein